MKEFTKADLKDGMAVEYRSGDRRLFICDTFISNDNYNPLENYDDSLLSKGCSDFDIMNVYKIKQISSLDCIFRIGNLELLWEHKEVKEMTLEEIEKELGYKIKVIGGKN